MDAILFILFGLFLTAELFITIYSVEVILDSQIEHDQWSNAHIEIWKRLDDNNINFVGKLIASIFVFPFLIVGTIIGYFIVLFIYLCVFVANGFTFLFTKRPKAPSAHPGSLEWVEDIEGTYFKDIE